MKVLSFSSSFPSSESPTSGIFVHQRLRAIEPLVEKLEVVKPTPWSPGYSSGPRCPSRAPQEIDGLRVHYPRYFYLPGVLKRLDGWWYYRGLLRWTGRYIAAQGRPDLLDAHFAWPDGVGVSYLAHRSELPYVITLRGTINPRRDVPCFRGRMADALCGASAVISVSRAMADIAREYGVRAERIHVIPNGVDATLFSPVSRSDARERLGLAPLGRLAVSVASLKPAKGHEDMIEALAQLPEDVQLMIVGSEPGRRGYLRRLESLARARSLGRRVTFAGSQPQQRVALYYSAADVSVLASHSEGCPNVVLESLACGTPVVATAVGAVPDILRPGETGEVVPPGEPAALARALEASLGRNWSRDRIRASVQDQSWDAVADEVLSVFGRVLGVNA